MSVIVMLYILWQGILGFLFVTLGVLAVFARVKEDFGRRGVGVLLMIIGVICLGFWVHTWGNAERTANGFLDAWAAASADYPDGRANTPEMPTFMDFNRIRNFEGNFPNWFRMRKHSQVRQVDKDCIKTDRDPSLVPVKVFLSDVLIHDSEADIDYTATIRIWIARDNDMVVDFKLEKIRFL